jgi:hypothetical protein
VVDSHERDDAVRQARDVAESLVGLAESWERRVPEEEVSELSRRMLFLDLENSVRLLNHDNDLVELISKLTNLRKPLLFGDGAEQVRWIAKKLCSSYGVNPRTFKRRKDTETAKTSAVIRVTARVKRDGS